MIAMDPIYDRAGKVKAWLDGSLVRDRDGDVRAWIDGDDVVGSQHAGWFEDGFFRDHSGNAVGFVKGASGGPSLPFTEFTPFEPFKGFEPFKPFTPFSPFKPFYSSSWSSATVDAFLGATGVGS